ncbi:unnamed protein product [Penicillium palitans]
MSCHDTVRDLPKDTPISASAVAEAEAAAVEAAAMAIIAISRALELRARADALCGAADQAGAVAQQLERELYDPN